MGEHIERPGRPARHPAPTDARTALLGHTAVRAVFALKRGYYRLKYRRLSLAPDVEIRGRIRLRRGVRVSVGPRTRINKLVRFAGPGEVRVGADCLLNATWIGAWTSVVIGDGCLLSDCELLDNNFHNLDPARRHDSPSPSTRGPIVIEDNVWIGGHALVLKGVRIGRGSVIGAATVVRTEVPAGVVVVGNPQQVVERFG